MWIIRNSSPIAKPQQRGWLVLLIVRPLGEAASLVVMLAAAWHHRCSGFIQHMHGYKNLPHGVITVVFGVTTLLPLEVCTQCKLPSILQD